VRYAQEYNAIPNSCAGPLKQELKKAVGERRLREFRTLATLAATYPKLHEGLCTAPPKWTTAELLSVTGEGAEYLEAFHYKRWLRTRTRGWKEPHVGRVDRSRD
jgi:hypothetical protein